MNFPIIVAELRKNSRERVRVTLDQWQGHNLLDLRVATQLTKNTKVWCGTQKGLSVNVALIPDLREALTAAEARARDLGLLDG